MRYAKIQKAQLSPSGEGWFRGRKRFAKHLNSLILHNSYKWMMTIRIIFFLPVAMILFSGCAQKHNNDKGATCFSNMNPQKIMHNGETRQYLSYIPASYDGSNPAPLMMNFHGFGGSASEFMNEADMRSLAESDTFILVYPQGSCLDGAAHWNPCPVGGDNKSTADDIGFVESMINEISAQYNVDGERMYAAGYSNGGMMAYGLAHYTSERIAAVASVSGAMLDCTGALSHPMPVLHLHGTSDGVLPYDENSYYSSVQSTLDYWIQFNKTLTTPTITSDNRGGMTIEHFVYDQGEHGVAVEHYKYLDGDHVWFTSTFQGQTTAELVWKFVSKFDINGLR